MGLTFVVAAIISIDYDNIVFIKVIAEIWRHYNKKLKQCDDRML